MEVDKLFQNVKNINQYISVTEDICRKLKNQKIQFNMSTIMSLKKVRSLEIEYFNKCIGNGAAFIIIDKMLELPPSKTWGLLGKELITLIQYWLDAARKHLIIHSSYWWSYIDFLLKFIKIMRSKDPTLPNLLVEGTAERLFDLATKPQPDVQQRQAILHCLNLCCAESSREIRFAMRHHFESYFTKLSSILASSGDLPLQYSILESLMRWLLPRQNEALRQSAAISWFPDNLYRREAVQIFLERSWRNFHQDGRDFLNAHNEGGDLVVSFICRRLTLGPVVVLSGLESRNVYLDVNSTSKSVSLVLDPRMLAALGVPEQATFDYLVIREDDVHTAILCRKSIEVTIIIKPLSELQLYPSARKVGNGDVCVVVSSSTNLKRLDNALRNIFNVKYQVLLDLENMTQLSPCNTMRRVCDSSEEDTRLSHPVQVTRRKHSGSMVRSRAPCFKSPSTASTTSLALLHDRLAALPKFKYDKEPVRVSLFPGLSSVTELTEADDRRSFASSSTRKLRHYGVCHKSVKIEKKVDSESSRNYNSPTPDEHAVSCLLVAAVGSDDSVINDTLERLSKNKDYNKNNIVDLLVREAFERNVTEENEMINEQVNVGTENIEATLDAVCENSNEIDDSQNNFVNVKKRNLIKRKTNEIVHEEKVLNTKEKINETIYEEDEIEKFFSQHMTVDDNGRVIVSPVLARKINETSSESSCENCLITNENYLNIDLLGHNVIIDCLNDIVDKVCEDFDKCTDIFEKEVNLIDEANMDLIQSPIVNKLVEPNDQKEDKISTKKFKISNEGEKPTKKSKTRPKIKIKLKFNAKKDKKTKTLKKKLDVAKIMSPIPESKDSGEPEIFESKSIHSDLELDVQNKNSSQKVDIEPQREEMEIVSTIVQLECTDKQIKDTVEEATAAQIESTRDTKVTPSNSKVNSPMNISPNLDTPLARRKRKLYSPKEQDDLDKIDVYTSDVDAKSRTERKIKTLKFEATCYKDIEKERNKIRQPRVRKGKSKAKFTPSSPRTSKWNDIFDDLKENVEQNESIRFADKKSKELAIFNFTDSEDEDFKNKKNEVSKRMSTTTLPNGDFMISTTKRGTTTNKSAEHTTTRRGRATNKVNYSEIINKKPVKPITRKRTQRKRYNLADEKMRDATKIDEHNSSLVIEKSDVLLKEPELILNVAPEMEIITDNEEQRTVNSSKKKIKTTIKKEKMPNKLKDNDRTLSPLPGLIVEETGAEELNDSISSQTIIKFKKIRDGDIVDFNLTQNLLNEKTDLCHFDIESEKEGEEENYMQETVVKSTKSAENMKQGKTLDESNIVPEIEIPRTTDPSQHLNENDSDKEGERSQIQKTVVKKAKNKKKGKTIDKFDTESELDFLGLKKTKNVKTYERSNIRTPELDTSAKTTKRVVKLEFTNKRSKTKVKENTIDLTHIPLEVSKIKYKTISYEKSEKSIDTIGKSPITAHGDINEAPPDSEMLAQNIVPRNLDIENLDHKFKDFYLDCRDKLNCTPNKDRKGRKSSCSHQSPRVSVARISIEEIQKYLPSSRSSNSSNSEKHFKPKARSRSVSNDNAGNKNRKVKNTHNSSKKDSVDKNVNQKKTTDITNDVFVTRDRESNIKKNLSHEQNTKDTQKKIFKRIKAKDSSNDCDQVTKETPSYKSKENSNKHKENKFDELINKIDATFDVLETGNTEIHKNNNNNTNIAYFDDLQDKETSANINKVNNSTNKKQNRSSDDLNQRNDIEASDRNNVEKNVSEKKCNRNTHKFDDIIKNIDNTFNLDEKDLEVNKKTLRKRSLSLSSNSTRNDNIRTLRSKRDKTPDSTFKRKDNNRKSPQRSDFNRTPERNDFKRTSEKSNFKYKSVTKRTPERTDIVTCDKRSEKSFKRTSQRSDIKRTDKNDFKRTPPTKRTDKTFKRATDTPASEYGKKTKVEEVLSESGPSISSVNEWFKRNAPFSATGSISQSYTDTIENVMEKLDTTLVEIHQNTSNKFIHLFVEAQKHLSELNTQKQEMYKQAKSEIAAEVNRLIEDKFAGIEKVSQEMDSTFTEQLKRMSIELIKEDFSQKRAMVVLLREDLQAVTDFMVKKSN